MLSRLYYVILASAGGFLHCGIEQTLRVIFFLDEAKSFLKWVHSFRFQGLLIG